ncbi:MAG: guanylate kinase [Anaplasma sp.]
MLVLSSPSGCGKTTVSNIVVCDKNNNAIRSISATTRSPRKGEVDGRDYFFLSEAEFFRLCESGEMLEHARVFGNYYGVPRKFVEENISSGRNILFVIDWRGAFRLMEVMRKSVVSVFMIPPSMEELMRRLQSRDGGNDQLKDRFEGAPLEISRCHRYDYVIVNEDSKKTAKKVGCILEAERMRASRQIGLKALLEESFP